MNPVSREHHYEWFFETLANPLRMKILLLLLDKPLSVSRICKAVGEEQSKVSHALYILRLCGLVGLAVRGRQHEYSSNKEVLLPLLSIADKYACRVCLNPCAQDARKKK